MLCLVATDCNPDEHNSHPFPGLHQVLDLSCWSLERCGLCLKARETGWQVTPAISRAISSSTLLLHSAVKFHMLYMQMAILFESVGLEVSFSIAMNVQV